MRVVQSIKVSIHVMTHYLLSQAYETHFPQSKCEQQIGEIKAHLNPKSVDVLINKASSKRLDVQEF